MITGILIKSNGEKVSGGEELIEQWRADSNAFIWIDIEQSPSVSEVDLLRSFGGHELTILDAHRHRHPPKVELFKDQTFILFKGIANIEEGMDFTHLQLALFVGERYLITRHNEPAYSINHWRSSENLDQYLNNPLVLALRILHYSSGRYLEQLLDFEASLSDLEDIMQSHANDGTLKDLIAYKTRLRKLRRVFDYHQKIARQLLESNRLKDPLDSESDINHQLQDLYERCERLYSLCSMYYEICGDLIEGYLSLTSHQLNLTMRVLTVITAVFVPLGFIAGLYGMNFEYMPELHYPNGYFWVLGFMIVTAVSLLSLFRWKKWL